MNLNFRKSANIWNSIVNHLSDEKQSFFRSTVVSCELLSKCIIFLTLIKETQ